MEGDRSDHLAPNDAASEADTQDPDSSQNIVLLDDSNYSENMFPESPSYDLQPEESLDPLPSAPVNQEIITLDDSSQLDDTESKREEEEDTKMETDIFSGEQLKRKHSGDAEEQCEKIQKVETFDVDTQSLDDEVSEINSAVGPVKRKFTDSARAGPSTATLLTPVRSSPRKITKRSNSCNACCDVTPPAHTPARSRAASVEMQRACTPARLRAASVEIHHRRTPARLAGEPVATIPEATESVDPTDSQNLHLELSPNTPDVEAADPLAIKSNGVSHSEPVVARDRGEEVSPGAVHVPHSLGFEYDSSRGSLGAHKSSERATDLDSTDTAPSLVLDSPDAPSTLASKLITKLSNGDSSTPTDGAARRGDDSTPDTVKNGIRATKSEFRSSTTPSTISPHNGHRLPLHTPVAPAFDIHIGQDEDGDFLSMYVVRTDNDLGQDMFKEFQRISKRFTMDPYMADVSKSNSPSSVTSAPGGGHHLPLSLSLHPQQRSSFASTASSSTSGSSNRTSDGAFVVPPPRTRAGVPLPHGASGVRGYRALLKKIQELLSHLTDSSEADDSSDKISAAVQVSPGFNEEKRSNGTASPEEMSRCDRATPKSSLKKGKTRGRRPLPGKTKRAILPTQAEEPEPEVARRTPSPHPPPPAAAASPDPPLLAPPPPDKVGAASTPRSASKAGRGRKVAPESPRPPTPLAAPPDYAGHPPGTLVLAKWVDKRYYSGKVQDMPEPNKYLIEFDDGHTKALLDEFIIFGDRSELPLRGQSVYAQVDDQQNYEPALVLQVEHNSHRTVTYTCLTDGELTVSVTASELYLTEDQARSLKETRPCATPSSPATPRRRAHRDLDLDNIIHGPRSVRSRDKQSALTPRRRIPSPSSPKASTSGVKCGAESGSSSRKRRPVSESSELSEGSGAGGAAQAPPLEEVAGVEPEMQKTPRKIDGVKAGPLQLKGAARQTTGKKNSKLHKFENDEQTVSLLGRIPTDTPQLFSGLNFLLTCSRPPRALSHEPRSGVKEEPCGSSEEETSATEAGSEREDREFSARPFNKERLREQIEAGGGTVYGHLEEVPASEYGRTRLVAPRPCHTAKYMHCLAVGVRALTHDWVVTAVSSGALPDLDSFSLPAGWSVLRGRFVDWPERGRRGSRGVFADQTVLVCGDPEFVKFWVRVVALAGGAARGVDEERPELAGALALVTDLDCPHQVQNKAQQDAVPLASTAWLLHCLIEGRVCQVAAHPRFSFTYAEPE